MIRRAFLFCLALSLFAGTAAAEDACMKNNPFGVLEFLQWNHDWNNHQYPSEAQVRKAARMMKEAGIGTVRMDFLWQDVEPRQGECDFAKYDRIVDILEEEGLAILGLLEYTTDWASPTGEWNMPNKDTSAYLAYVRRTVTRYKNRVRYWEIWNEPDSPIYWKEQDSLRSYCKMLAQAYAAIKEIDPGATVLNGGLTHNLASVNHLYDNGGKGYFDALNIHIFINPGVTGSIKNVTSYIKACARIMARNGDGDKKIWVTETGCPGVRRGKQVKQWWLGRNPTEGEQGRWLAQLYGALLKEPSVEKAFWAFFRDANEHWHDGTDYLGMVRNDFTPKPAYRAYMCLTRKWRQGKAH